MTKKKKILVLGATGTLGAEMLHQLSKLNEFDVTGGARNLESLKMFNRNSNVTLLEFDAKNFIASPDSYLFDSFDLIINAIGAIKQKNTTSDDLYLLNSVFPKAIAKNLINNETRLIHFTTDCVFKGDIKNLKTESTVHDAIDDYGRSKSAGEISQDNVWNLRASFIGAERNSNFSLLNWFLNQKKGTTVNGFINHIWNGVTTFHYAKIVTKIVEHDGFPESRFLNLIPKDEITKFHLLEKIAYYFNRQDIVINRVSGVEDIFRKIDTNFPLQNLALWNSIGKITLPSIEELISELAIEYKSRNYLLGNQFRRTN